MKEKVNLRLVTGDENLVTKDEIYVAFNEVGTITALKKRNDSGTLVTIVSTPVEQYVLEDEKSVEVDPTNITTEGNYDITVNPSTGYDGMKKAVVTLVFPDSNPNPDPGLSEETIGGEGGPK